MLLSGQRDVQQQWKETTMFNFIHEFGYWLFWGSIAVVFLYFAHKGIWIACALDDHCYADNIGMLSAN